MLQHQFLPCFAGDCSGETHSVWHGILHWLHFSIAIFSSGILQVQKTWMESAAFDFVCRAVLRCFVLGNANSLPCSKQSCKFLSCLLRFLALVATLDSSATSWCLLYSALNTLERFFSSNSAPHIFSSDSSCRSCQNWVSSGDAREEQARRLKGDYIH